MPAPLLVPPCPRCTNATDFLRLGDAVKCAACGHVRVAQ